VNNEKLQKNKVGYKPVNHRNYKNKTALCKLIKRIHYEIRLFFKTGYIILKIRQKMKD